MPKIGMRIIKSSMAVMICFLISFLRPEGIVFYSCIAAVLCIQQDVKNSKRVAINRVKGTLLGGICGMFVLIVEKNLLVMDILFLRYLFISLMIIPIIYSTVLLKMTSASYISCVVFMSVTISHAMDIEPYVFAFNRIIDTLIGIFVALGLNMIHFYRHRNQDILFVSDLDHTLLNEKGELSAYTKVRLKQLLEQGAQITIATAQTPSSFLPMLQDIPFTLPMITMNGAAMFDIHHQEYHHCKVIPNQCLEEVLMLFEEAQVNCFIHTIVHHMLHVYYQGFQNPVEEDMYHTHRKTPYKNYVCSNFPKEQSAIYLHAIHETAIIHQLYESIKTSRSYDELHIVITLDQQHPGYSKIDIYQKDAGKKQAVESLKQEHSFHRVYVFGDDLEDLPLMGWADRSFAVKNAKKEILAHAEMISSNEDDGVVHAIHRLFYEKS